MMKDTPRWLRALLRATAEHTPHPPYARQVRPPLALRDAPPAPERRRAAGG